MTGGVSLDAQVSASPQEALAQPSGKEILLVLLTIHLIIVISSLVPSWTSRDDQRTRTFMLALWSKRILTKSEASLDNLTRLCLKNCQARTLPLRVD